MRENAAAYIAIGSAVVLAAALAWRSWLTRKPSAEELERRRRLALNQFGKMADAMVLDVGESAIEYSYDVRGVGYTATQDITALQDRLPQHRLSVAGPAAVKYDPRNPANSIVLCEDWSGLRGLAGMGNHTTAIHPKEIHKGLE
jgi:hypothetical protein